MSRRVLIVDDDQGIRELLAEFLTEEGYETAEAGDGQEGIDQVLAFHPDAVIVDLMMPIMNGWEFAEACHRLPEYRALPLIAISAARDLTRQTEELEKKGIVAALAKPFNIHQLLELIEHATDNHVS
jgi:CheY-like chemotaxis protein